MAVALQGAHTLAVIATLQAAGLTVGDAAGTTGAGAPLALPYAVVYDITDSASGTLGKRNEDAEFVYQVTCVGRTPAEARYVRDKAMALLNGFSVAGRSILLVRKEPGTGTIHRDDDLTPPLFYTTPRFRVLSVPS